MNFDTTSALLAAVHDYCERDLAKFVIDIDRSDTIPECVFDDLVALRLFAFVSLSNEGQEMSVLHRTEVLFQCLTIISETSPAVAEAVMDQNFGQIGMMREYGNPTIQAKLEQIRTGSKQAAFLMTEPQSGSDLSQFSTTYEQVIGGVVISGAKDWITGAARRQYFVTLAKEAGSARNFGLFFHRSRDRSVR